MWFFTDEIATETDTELVQYILYDTGVNNAIHLEAKFALGKDLRKCSCSTRSYYGSHAADDNTTVSGKECTMCNDDV